VLCVRRVANALACALLRAIDPMARWHQLRLRAPAHHTRVTCGAAAAAARTCSQLKTKKAFVLMETIDEHAEAERRAVNAMINAKLFAGRWQANARARRARRGTGNVAGSMSEHDARGMEECVAHLHPTANDGCVVGNTTCAWSALPFCFNRLRYLH
jgi:hypothetical protein